MRERTVRWVAGLATAVFTAGVVAALAHGAAPLPRASADQTSPRPTPSDGPSPAFVDPKRGPTTTTTLPPPPTTTTTRRPAARAAAPTTSITAAPAAPAPQAPPPADGRAVCIGDSVMKGAGPEWRNLLTACRVVDAVESRQFHQGPATVSAHAGELGRALVVHLGTNGNLTGEQLDAVVAAAGDVARIVFVNIQVHGTRSWEDPNNLELSAGVKRCGPRCVLADWKNTSEPHADWFGSDGIHLTAAGAQGYANLIARALS